MISFNKPKTLDGVKLIDSDLLWLAINEDDRDLAQSVIDNH